MKAGQAGPVAARGRADDDLLRFLFATGRFAPWPCCPHCAHPDNDRHPHFAPCDEEECMRSQVEERIYGTDPLMNIDSGRLMRAALAPEERVLHLALLRDGLAALEKHAPVDAFQLLREHVENVERWLREPDDDASS